VLWVAGVVEAGSDVGCVVGAKVELSPPHAARSNTRIRMMPGIDNPGKNRAAGLLLKATPPCLYGLGVAVEIPTFALHTIKTGLAHYF